MEAIRGDSAPDERRCRIAREFLVLVRVYGMYRVGTLATLCIGMWVVLGYGLYATADTVQHDVSVAVGNGMLLVCALLDRSHTIRSYFTLLGTVRCLNSTHYFYSFMNHLGQPAFMNMNSRHGPDS